ncbi:VMAP-C domain-containing protein [Streptomyces hebeiensis]
MRTVTRSPAWHARIDIDGAAEGSGFLVADRTVLTCAHVLRHHDRAEIIFPGAPGLGPLGAGVVARGAWAGGDRDPGDLAVLRLDRPVGIAPAAFAPLDGPYASPSPKLVAHGFPLGYGEEGVQSELRATSMQLIRDEWAQLEFWREYGQKTDHGFSGAAVVLADAGTVTGMVVSYDPVNRNGRMIPAQVLARHWAPLADLVPTPGYPTEEKRRLRELVARSAALPGPPPGQLLRTVVGRLGVDPPTVEPGSLWEAVWYLLSESPPRPAALPLAELAVRVAGLVDDEALGEELRAWSRAHRARHDARGTAQWRWRPAPADRTGHGGFTAVAPPCGQSAPATSAAPAAQETRTAPETWTTSRPAVSSPPAPERGLAADGHLTPHPGAGAHPATDRGRSVGPVASARTTAATRPGPAAAPSAPRWSPILVEIRRSGAGNGTARLVSVSTFRGGHGRLLAERRLAQREVRAWVLHQIDLAFGDIDQDGRALIGFALPRSALNQPVDQWVRKGDPVPLGCKTPLVVMDHDRRSNPRLQHELTRLWDLLDHEPRSAVRPIACGPTVRPELLSVELQGVRGPVGLARPPRTTRDRALHKAVLSAPAPIVLWPRTGCSGGTGCPGSCQGNAFLTALAEQLSHLPPGDLPEQVFDLRKRAFLHNGPEPHWAAELSFVWEDPRWFPEMPRMSGSPVG